MAAGAYLFLKSEREYYDREREREVWEVEKYLSGEKAEMLIIYREQGHSEEDAANLVEIKSKNREVGVDEMMVQELGLLPAERQPILSTLATFGAFLIAGSAPLLVYLLAGLA